VLLLLLLLVGGGGGGGVHDGQGAVVDGGGVGVVHRVCGDRGKNIIALINPSSHRAPEPGLAKTRDRLSLHLSCSLLLFILVDAPSPGHGGPMLAVTG